MTSDANALSRHYIASQTSHRTENPLEVITRPRRLTVWTVARNAAALGFCVLVMAIFWIGSGR